MRLNKTVVLFAFCSLLGVKGTCQSLSTFSDSCLPRPYLERMRWWCEARFGIFIHWGPVSVKGTEISWSRANTNPKCPNKGNIPADEYDNLYKIFNPTNFNADEWVSIIKESGAKYIVLTAKHCDGFLLWHSETDHYNISATPFKRDICKEFANSARKKGIRIGWYYSPMDWRDPDFRTERNELYIQRMRAHLTELLTHYGRIDLLWFDWDGGEPVYAQDSTYCLVKILQPRIIINNRLDLGPTNSDKQILSIFADYYTPEQYVGAYNDQLPWESCMTLSAKNQWAYGGPQDGVKSLDACLNMLIYCAGGDGNLLLNVGPTPDGRIPENQVQRLRQIGKWLAKYGETIYGTRGGPFKPGSYGASTRKANTIYLHIRNWNNDTLKLPPIPGNIVLSRCLTGGKVTVTRTESGIEVYVPPEDRDPFDTIVELTLDIYAHKIPAVSVPEPVSLTRRAKVTASNVFQNQPEYAPQKAVDGNEDTRWATDWGVKSAWLEVDFGEPKTFNRVLIKQAYPELQRIRNFRIEYFQDNQWKVCYAGGVMGETASIRFAPVTAQKARLNIIESTDGPTIKEFHIYSP